MKAAGGETTVKSIQEAHGELKGLVNRTPLLPGDAFADLLGDGLFLKCENLQKTGSFKFRGAFNRLRLLSPEQKKRGVAAASAGNHAQGVALAARMMGVEATIVMPADAPIVKAEATRAHGARVVLHGNTFDESFAHMKTIAAETGALIVHPFDDPAIIAGQGTVGLEILEDLPEVDRVLVPVGGGGLGSGVALAVKSLRPEAEVIGIQAAGAPALHRSWHAGRLIAVPPRATLADGLAIEQPRQRTMDLLRQYLDDMVVVEEEDIARAILLIMERTSLVAEGSGAITLGALLAGRIPPARGSTAAIISGGNIDVNVISRIIERGMIREGRYLRLRTTMTDRPGALRGVVRVLADMGANVITINHDRLLSRVPMGETAVEFLLETRDRVHIEEVLAAVAAAGYECEEISGS